MNCTEVQSRLADFIEETLDSETLQEVEGHLSMCATCRVEAEGLADCMRQVAALPLLDPPLGFTHRVMARVREIEITPPFWRRLLLPLRFKLPLHATAVILVAVLAVYLFQREENPKLAPPLSEPELAVEKSETPPGNIAREAKLAATGQAEANLQSEANRQKDSLSAAKENKVTDQIAVARRMEPSAVRPSISEPRESLAGKKEEPRVVLAPPPPPVKGLNVSDEASRVARSPVLEFRGGPFTPAAPLKSESAPIPSPRATTGSPATSLPIDADFVVRRHPPERDAEASGGVGVQKKPAEDASVFREMFLFRSDQLPVRRLLPHVPQATGPQILWLTIPASQFEQLRKELGELGVIELESLLPSLDQAALAKRGSSLRIKITIEPFGDAAHMPVTPRTK